MEDSVKHVPPSIVVVFVGVNGIGIYVRLT